MSLFSSGPPEIIAGVFRNFDNFTDVYALALTCKKLRSIWISDTTNIILQVGRASVLSFDEALIAVRATEIVKIAKESRQLCPEIDIPSLSAAVQQPTLLEIKSVLNLRHFVRFIEYQFLRTRNINTSWGGHDHLLDASPHLLPTWRLGFHRALYRFFIVGAALVRAYHIPLYENFARIEGWSGDGFLGETISQLAGQNDGFKIHHLPVTAEELHVLNEYPIYNFTPHAGWENCFGPLGDWLVGDIHKRLQLEYAEVDNEPADEQAILREIMQLLVISGQFFDMEDGIWLGSEEPYWSKHYYDSNNCCICQSRLRAASPDATEEYIPMEGPEERMRRFSYVYFGHFMHAEFQLPAVREFNENSYFGRQVAMETEQDITLEYPDIPNIYALCGLLHCMSERPNRVNGHPAPHPPLHFFAFVLRKHFGYQFDEMAFEMNSPKPLYANFIRQGGIFADKEVVDGGIEGENEWEGLLTSMLDVQVLTYLQTSWE